MAITKFNAKNGLSVGTTPTDVIDNSGNATLGTVTATSVNNLTLTAPATSATLTIANGKTVTVNNTLTFTGTDSSSVAFGAGGTVAYTGTGLNQFASTTSSQLAGVISDETGTGALVFANTPTLISPVLGQATATSLQATAIGNVTAGSGAFTSLSATTSVDFSSVTGTVNIQPSGALTLNSGTTGSLNNINIGVSTAGTGRFTTIAGTDATDSSSTTTGALKTAGGLGVVKNAYIGGSALISGNLDVQSDVNITGTLYTANLVASSSVTLTVTDPLLYLQSNSSYPWTYDTGIYSNSIGGPANTYVHHGMVRNYTNSNWGFFSNVKSEPGSTINWNDAGLIWDPIKAGSLILANTTGSSSTTTGALVVGGGVGIAENLYVGGTAWFGAPTLLNLSGGMAVFTGNANSYVQINTQNLRNGAYASSDFIATADNGTDTNYYIDMGINSSAYNQAEYSIMGPNSGYVYVAGGNLSIGTATVGKDIVFHAGGTTAANEIARINTTGFTTGQQITSTVAQGTAPFVVASTTKVTGLNVESVDGYHAAENNIAGNLTARDSTGNINVSGVKLYGTTSGTVTLIATDIAGTTKINFPATSGTVITSGDTGTVTSTMIADGTIVNADINASAAIAVSKLAASTISGISLGGTLATLTVGSYLTGTNYTGASASTLAVDATSANTASKVVARDSSGNFSAGNITLSGMSSSGAVVISNNTANNGTTYTAGALQVTGGVGIGGNLYVQGNVYTNHIISEISSILQVDDPLLYLIATNPGTYNYETGIIGQFGSGASYQHTGVVRDHNDGVWKIFSNVASEPIGGTITFTGAIYDAVKAGSLVLANSTASTSTTTGALVVTGGAGFGGNVFASGFSGTYYGSGAGLTSIPNSALTNSSVTVNGTAISLGGSGTVTANANTLTGTTLNSTVVTSSLTTVGTIGTGVWQGSEIATTYTAAKVTSVNGSTGAVTGLATTAGNLAQFAATTSSQLAGVISDETGSGSLVFGTSPTFTTDITVPAIAHGGTTGVGNIGSSVSTFNTIFARATSANYADLAEKYLSDIVYEPATVVSFGGDAEVTASTTDMDTAIAGVVSTNPAYLMNSALNGTTVTVALTGRVPCKVVGPVRKGNMMVSDGHGRARAEANPVIGSVIGKALENFDGTEGIIEVVVGRL